MLVSRVIRVQNESVNLEEDALETVRSESACLRTSVNVKSPSKDTNQAPISRKSVKPLVSALAISGQSPYLGQIGL